MVVVRPKSLTARLESQRRFAEGERRQACELVGADIGLHGGNQDVLVSEWSFSMTSILGKIFGNLSNAPSPNRGDVAYDEAMEESDQLLKMLRDSAKSTDAARAVMADIWAQNRNVPFLTSVTETVQEMKSSIEQKPSDFSK